MAARDSDHSPRPRRTPPSATIPLRVLRTREGWSLTDLQRQIAERLPSDVPPPTRGALSAIECGLRGPSEQLIELLTAVYALPAGCIQTDYTRRTRSSWDAA